MFDIASLRSHRFESCRWHSFFFVLTLSHCARSWSLKFLLTVLAATVLIRKLPGRATVIPFRFRPSLLHFGTTANITWLPPVWNKQILSQAAPLYMHNLHSSSPSERENYLSYRCFCLLKCVEVSFHITDWGEVVDFDLGMRLGENACEMLNNDGKGSAEGIYK